MLKNGLSENRGDVIEQKLSDGHIHLPNPGILKGTTDLSCLPQFEYMNVFSYLMSNDISLGTIRDYRKLGEFIMMVDGHITGLKTICYEDSPGHFALKAKVKPRTRGKDPVTGAVGYFPWIVTTLVGVDKRSCILSGFCTMP